MPGLPARKGVEAGKRPFAACGGAGNGSGQIMATTETVDGKDLPHNDALAGGTSCDIPMRVHASTGGFAPPWT